MYTAADADRAYESIASSRFIQGHSHIDFFLEYLKSNSKMFKHRNFIAVFNFFPKAKPTDMTSFFKFLTIIFYTFVLKLKFCLSCETFYSVIPEIDNKVGTTHLLQETKASSLSLCGSLCINSCNCFGYNRQKEQCRLHVICDVGNMSVTDAGWRYYRVSREGMENIFI